MSSLGLKTNIIVNTGIIFFFGMVLTAFMVLSLTQRLMVNSLGEKGKVSLTAVSELILSAEKSYDNVLPENLSPGIRAIMTDAGISGLMIIHSDSGRLYEYGNNEPIRKKMETSARTALVENQATILMYKDGWGLFWKHARYMILSSPVEDRDGLVAGVSLLLPISPVFEKLHSVVKIMFIYICVNLFLMTFAAVHQISKVTIKPIHRLLGRATSYRADMAPTLFKEKAGNEFGQLSAALNSMLGRISDDREKLKETVSSLELANDELKKAHKDILRAEKLASVGRLSSGIAHEIGNPLGIVSGYLELIKDESLESKTKADFIDRAEKEIQRIDRIIRQLLDYARKTKENVMSLSLDGVLRDVIDMVRVQPFMQSIVIDSEPVPESVRVKAEPDQLKQVFLNLIINAADAINGQGDRTEGQIDISVQQEEEIVSIQIKDNGAGIAESDLDSVFDPFYTTKEPGKGTGLGLSVCFMIIEDLEGTIGIESDGGNGTTVTIRLPLAK